MGSIGFGVDRLDAIVGHLLTFAIEKTDRDIALASLEDFTAHTLGWRAESQ